MSAVHTNQIRSKITLQGHEKKGMAPRVGLFLMFLVICLACAGDVYLPVGSKVLECIYARDEKAGSSLLVGVGYNLNLDWPNTMLLRWLKAAAQCRLHQFCGETIIRISSSNASRGLTVGRA